MSAGLHNIKVETYRTDGCGGAYRIGTGYIVTATDSEGKSAVHVETPEGFNDAVREVLEQIHGIEVDFISVDPEEFSVDSTKRHLNRE